MIKINNQNSLKYRIGISQIKIDNFSSYWIRIEIDINDTDPLVWLSRQTMYPKMYWLSRDRKFEIACLQKVFSLNKLPTIIRSSFLAGSFVPNIKLYGIYPFNNNIKHYYKNSWGNLSGTYFFLPEFEIVRENNRNFLAFNNIYSKPQDISIGYIYQILREIYSLHPKVDKITNSIKQITYMPKFEVWSEQIKNALNEIKYHKLTKVVIARQKIITFNEVIKPLTILKILRKHTPNTYNFAIALDSQNTFLGISPEKLYKRHKIYIETEAIAGTRPRGFSINQDKNLSLDLLKSSKDLHEVSLVYKYLQEQLSNLCQEITSKEEYSILQTRSVQHLYSCLNGNLNENFIDKKIIKTLHPTPAICGVPVSKALASINKYEAFPRGGYGSPIGWIGENSTHLSIAIRSTLIKNHRMIIFAGCGIVKGSNATEEWNETENKMSQFDQFLYNL
nr:isochorismate synthase [Cavernulicola chilensis]